MADFRRCIFAFIVVGLLLGATTTMYAQGPAFVCTASAGVPPILRSEGLTELAGDLVINCTGGTPSAAGTPLNTKLANITLFFNTQVTSRIIGTVAGQSLTDALLLIDEPGPGAQTVCTDVQGAGRNNCNVLATGTATSPFTQAGAFNVFQGVLNNASSVTFQGIPIEPPGSTGTRVFRFTNIRVNASALQPSGTLPGQVTAFISYSGSTSLPLTNTTAVVGFTQQGLTGAVRVFDVTNGRGGAAASATDRTFQQCTDVNNVGDALKVPNLVVRFGEGFPTAFKTQGIIGQNTPNAVYNTESGFTGVPGVATYGLANYGTRLKATFTNIPAGVSVFVPVAYSAAGVSVALTAAEASPFFTPVPATNTFSKNAPQLVTNGAALYPNGLDVVGVALTNGNGTAVYEVTGASSTATSNLDIPVYFVYTASPGTGSPAAGTGTVTVSFAPTYDVSSTGTPAAAQASATLPIPRFVSLLNPINLITVAVCRTNLLFPYLASVSGFDTGIAIANTSSDPFGTTAQSGNCTLNFFGTGAPSAKTIGPVAGGTTATLLGSTDFPNFAGYVIAVCNFQFAHGFAFISDLGARNWGTVYLADIIPDVKPRFAGTLTDVASGEALGQ